MTPQEITAIIQAINDSGLIEKLNQKPDPGNILINVGYILLTLLAIKALVLNGSVRKFFNYEETKVTILGDIKGELIELKTNVEQDHKKLKDVLRMLEGKRASDRAT